MKILFGGTFDPIHIGHIKLALHISNEFSHKVSLLPLGGVPNYKALPEAKLEDRLSMLSLVETRYNSQLEVDYTEANNPDYSPTYFTLKQLRLVYGKDMPLFFVIGGDSLFSIESWDNWQNLFELTNFIVAIRPDYPLETMSANLKALITPRFSNEVNPFQAAGQIVFTTFAPIQVSSTQIRRMCKEQQDISNLVIPEVAEYIFRHQLYKGN